MKQLGEFLKTTIMGGLLVLFPLIACVFVILREDCRALNEFH